MTKKSQNGHSGLKQRLSGLSLGLGLTLASMIVTLGTLLSFSNVPSEEMAKLLLWQSIRIADVGRYLVKKESEKKKK